MKHVIFAAVLCMACAAEAEGEDFELVSNRYDHLGRRVQKITPGATHTYFYDGWLLVKEVVERSGDTRRCGVSPRRHGGAGSSTSSYGNNCQGPIACDFAYPLSALPCIFSSLTPFCR